MRSQSLFGEIVLRTALHPENVATESLLYLLKTHLAWNAMRSLLGPTGVVLPEVLTFKSQVRSEQDGSIPDLSGVDSDDDVVLILESKFWAGLTPNQPLTYLRRLCPTKPGIMLVVAPSQRFDSLWNKLVQRCEEAALLLHEAATPARELQLRFRRLGTDHFLALTTWRALLNVLGREADVRGDGAFSEDVEQLHGLCARMDSDAFLPLNADELAPSIGRRVQQFVDLVDDIVTELDRRGDSTKSMTVGGSQSTYGRFFEVGDIGCFLSYSPSLWARYGDSPMWLQLNQIIDGHWSLTPQLRESLSRACANSPQRVQEADGRLVVALELPLSVERDEVISQVIEQINSIVQRLSPPIRAI